jgi:protein Tob/BTG
MINQILTAVDFLAHFMNAANIFTEEQIRHFKKHLSDLLTERYTGHWYLDQPCKGQGHRCIRINGRMTEVTIQEAAKASGLNYEDLNLPLEITISVDPNDVSYR